MKNKRGLIWLWILIVLILIATLIFGGYLYSHNKQPMLKKDGGNDYYVQGMVYEKTFLGWKTYTGDTCNGNEIQEKIVNKDNAIEGRYYASFEAFNCPNGCRDGACL